MVASRFDAVKPVTLPTDPVKFPVNVVVKAVVTVVAAFVPAIKTPPAAPAVADGKKSVFVLTDETFVLMVFAVDCSVVRAVVVASVPTIG